MSDNYHLTQVGLEKRVATFNCGQSRERWGRRKDKTAGEVEEHCFDRLVTQNDRYLVQSEAL